MIQKANECVGCEIPCIGSICGYRNVTRFFCDVCDEEKKIYHYKGEHYCIDCIIEDMELEEVEAYED